MVVVWRRLAAGCWWVAAVLRLVAAVLRLVAAFLDLLEYLLKELNWWSVWMLLDEIWIRFFTQPACWQNSAVIFEKSYRPHMTSFLADIWSVYRSLSKESKTIEFPSIGLRKLQILNFEWEKVNIGRLRDLTLKDVISMIFLFLFLLHCISRKVWMLAF